ncbi:MAG: hypothetical protein VKP62_01540 [Candidatus Sericytochromatia bacterium]|nr:hypothetical protein [Candidatus Sericytochromatia bacterium]
MQAGAQGGQMEHDILGARVHTHDGEAGRVTRIVVSAAKPCVSQLVVRRPPPGEREVLVPTSLIALTCEQTLWLDCSLADLASMPDYDADRFEEANPAWPVPVALPFGGIWWAPHLEAPHADAGEQRGPKGLEVSLVRGTPVTCTDGGCGRMENVLLDDDSHALTALVIRQGLFFPRDLAAPSDWIDHMDNSGIHLKLSCQQLDERAEYY